MRKNEHIHTYITLWLYGKGVHCVQVVCYPVSMTGIIHIETGQIWLGLSNVAPELSDNFPDPQAAGPSASSGQVGHVGTKGVQSLDWAKFKSGWEKEGCFDFGQRRTRGAQKKNH